LPVWCERIHEKKRKISAAAPLPYILGRNGNSAAARFARGDTKATILVADDEPAVLLVSAAILNRCGYKVLMAATGDEALSAFQNAQDTIHLVISDFVMPGMNGYEFVRSVQELSPATGVLLMSAARPRASRFGVVTMAKPFTAAILVRKVRTLLAACNFAQIEREQSTARSQRRNGHKRTVST
jgi:DNA-binding NtrC family response regulator